MFDEETQDMVAMALALFLEKTPLNSYVEQFREEWGDPSSVFPDVFHGGQRIEVYRAMFGRVLMRYRDADVMAITLVPEHPPHAVQTMRVFKRILDKQGMALELVGEMLLNVQLQEGTLEFKLSERMLSCQVGAFRIQQMTVEGRPQNP